MKRFAATLLAATFMAGTAHAADLIIAEEPMVTAVEAASDWTGFYAGVVGGYGSGTSTYTGVAPTTTVGLAGGLLGVTLGYNHQWDMFVLGVEGDIAWSNISGTGALPVPPFPAASSLTSTVNWVGTLRGRAGVAFDSVLLFATAGVATGGVTTTPNGVPGGTAYSSQKTGWTAGVGVEAKVTDDISLKAEYAYTDLGTNTIPAGALAGGSPAADLSTNFHAVKIGANFHF